jgi:DNA-binding XRE family transcriptional regulator
MGGLILLQPKGCEREIMFEKYTELMNSPDGKLARKMAHENYNLLFGLIEHRIAAGLTQQDVANSLGISQQAVAKFESMDNDPRLSTISQYALAINALVTHKISDALPKKVKKSSVR